MSDQSDWRYCDKCKGLHYAAGALGSCPGGGAHIIAPSGNYTVAMDDAAAPGQPGWRYCDKCKGLHYAAGPLGPCPAGGVHLSAPSSHYTIFQLTVNFTFDPAITQAQINTLLERHQFAYSRITACGNLSAQEKQALRQAYRRPIHHGIESRPNVNASATVNGSRIDVNFGVLFPQGTVEIAQTLIHEMMHCAGFTHPKRRDPPAGMSCAAPNPAIFDCPFDNGQYYGTPPLRAEICIAGSQSDMALVGQKAGEDSCIIDGQGIASIHRL